jgi:hypothetical protein
MLDVHPNECTPVDPCCFISFTVSVGLVQILEVRNSLCPKLGSRGHVWVRTDLSIYLYDGGRDAHLVSGLETCNSTYYY